MQIANDNVIIILIFTSIICEFLERKGSQLGTYISNHQKFFESIRNPLKSQFRFLRYNKYSRESKPSCDYVIQGIIFIIQMIIYKG